MGKRRGGDGDSPGSYTFSLQEPPLSSRAWDRDGGAAMARLVLTPVPSTGLLVLLMLLPGTAPSPGLPLSLSVLSFHRPVSAPHPPPHTFCLCLCPGA